MYTLLKITRHRPVLYPEKCDLMLKICECKHKKLKQKCNAC